jgi:spore coat protein U-like protein
VSSEEKLKTSAKLIAYLLLAGWMVGAAAQTATATFQVTANVQASCSVAATNLAFGQYDPFAAAALGGTSSVNITCTNQHPYNFSVPTPTARSMAGPGGFSLNYGLYNEAAYSSGFGGASVGTGSSQAFTVHGRIPAGQTTAVVGNYADTVTVSVTY